MTSPDSRPTPDPAVADERAFLADLGLRVRARREAAGFTRRSLAAQSGVSERYLAQLELGSGNVSMLLMRKLAHALASPLGALIEPTVSPSLVERSSLRSLMGMLEGLDDLRLDQAREMLVARFGQSSAARRSRIALIGLRGAGKSTIGQRLAGEMNVRFIELDAEIESELGVDLAGIFSLYGQDAYRDAEARALDRLLAEEGSFVIATGGSIVTVPTTYATLRANCFTVWLKAAPADHMARVIEQGDMRPMHGRDHAMLELQGILRAREALYQLADQTVDSSRSSIQECVSAIVAGSLP